MNLVTGAVGSLLPKLLQLLGNEYNLQRGLKKKVKYHEQELRSIDALLKKVSHVPSDQLDEQIMVWARDIREASYDMEDILDTILVHIEGRKPNDLSRLQRAVNKMKNLFCKIKVRHDVGKAIQDIMKHLQEVADRRARYKIEDHVVNSTAINTSTSNSDPRLKAMYKEVTSLVGIDKPCNDLLSKLSDGQGDYMSRQKKKIVSIFGTGGLGKTTIARVVYDKLIAYFECQAFVAVGRNPNLVKLLMDILYELDKSKYSDIHTKKVDKKQLIDRLREFLQNQRYIIVIDDIWETESWTEAMDLALLENNFGSRIIITTRNAQVAKQIGDEVYNIQPLSHGNAIKLFYAKAVESELDGMVRGCRVHDMVLDLIRSFSTKENFITVVDNDRGTVSPPPIKVRRLALHGNIMEHTAQGNTLDIPQVRSFIAIRCSFGNQVVPLSSFKLLRVLDMEACKNVSRSHLIHLEKLLHLRYLGLERALIEDLPDEIGALKLLQTLNLDRTRIRQLTESISQLTQLVCLKGDRVKTLAPNWIGKLPSLEELQMLMPPYGRKKALSSHRNSEFCIYEASSSVVYHHVLVQARLPYLAHLSLLVDSLTEKDLEFLEVGEVEAELRKATMGHPNRPMLEVYRWNEDKIIPTVQDQKKDKVSVEEEGQNQLEGNPMPDEGNKLKHG
ncbi:hypothetical protein PR202_gb13224 [Eleusine coracana subsp. coracana]|uniref:AAA+ ATPase domain-containing protein n=1 Tax=Eleusine coracana subsp. coracana TaxID=191504 RepID=A0AAV5ESN7_ELECO|nr:hypothetical protein PR202_gb13224 [Eleusine coracana subsp. coracana]